jgi:uncharacterized protein YeaO (DUF488 family)
MEIRVKRIYDERDAGDGTRVLVDRLWPRGVRKDDPRIDAWVKAVAPSNELRTWFHRDLSKFEEFARRYRAELDENPEAVEELLSHVDGHTLTLLYASKDTERNHAAVLAEYLRGQE